MLKWTLWIGVGLTTILAIAVGGLVWRKLTKAPSEQEYFRHLEEKGILIVPEQGRLERELGVSSEKIEEFFTKLQNRDYDDANRVFTNENHIFFQRLIDLGKLINASNGRGYWIIKKNRKGGVDSISFSDGDQEYFISDHLLDIRHIKEPFDTEFELGVIKSLKHKKNN